MATTLIRLAGVATVLAALCATSRAAAAEIGQIKTANGQVTIERDGARCRRRSARDCKSPTSSRRVPTVRSGSRWTTIRCCPPGPNSELSLDRYAFDATTNQGRFDTSLNKGTLAVISGRIAKQVTRRDDRAHAHAILGVRGTEFVVSAE